jgi:polyisoprenoid-binding protein YceI
LLTAGALAGVLVSCTAVRVVTHSTSSDPVDAPAGRYELDPHHWSVVFDVDHLGYARFVMRFDQVSGRLDFAPQDPEGSRLTAEIAAASIDTNDPELDRMVKGPDMLDAVHYPVIRFESTGTKRTGDSTGEVDGNLIIRDRTLPVRLLVKFNGGAANPLSRDYTLGFTATASFDRSQLGLGTWFPAVGDRVNVAIQAEFVKTTD